MSQTPDFNQRGDLVNVFVYGSLLKDFWNHRPFAPWLVAWEPGAVAGLRLVHLPQGYPAAFPTDRPDARVVGELQTFHSSDEVLKALDEMEDYDPDAPSESMYARRRVVVERPDDLAPVEAWCYIYVAFEMDWVLARGGVEVASGDWRAFVQRGGS